MKKNIFLLLVLLSSFCFSQNKIEESSIMTYYEGEGYLQLFIESTLKELKNNNEKKLFKSVNVLNRLFSENNFNDKVQDLLESYSTALDKNKSEYTEEDKKLRENIKQSIIEYEYFLRVKTITLVELVEFQFQLSKTRKTNNDFVNSQPIKELIITEDVFINPKDSNYKQILKNSIQKLFSDSNSPPIAELYFLGEKLKPVDSITIPINTDFEIDGSTSGDFETENLRYIWRNVTPPFQKIQTTKKLNLIKNAVKQTINLDEINEYKLGFSVHDGITKSNEIILNIKTKPKPKKIEFSSNIVQSNNFLTIFKFKKGIKTKMSGIFRINKDSINENDIIISEEKLKNKVFKKNDTSIVKIINSPRLINSLLVLNSNFENEFSKDYYVYSKDKLDYISQENKITHSKKTFLPFSVNVDNSFVLIQDNKSKEDPDLFSTIIGVRKIYMNFLLSRNIEFSFGLSNFNKTVDYEDYKLDFPASYLELKYIKHNYSLSKKENPTTAYLKGIYTSYNSRVLNPNNESGFDYKSFNSIGLGIGSTIKFLWIKDFDLDLKIDLSYSRFLDELQNLGATELSIGLIYRPFTIH
ncbi:hypothetical protein [Olleya sp. R77988]|uniref:hypothetical protein n=1 Tax=Olleya sp. R77988 TaxID=3093875 RepID=UPI0037CA0E58